ncbi:hypothetical protein HMPREF9057_01831 [Actinomyces sp. oral taxon 171 str. F0337]|nr:hypothetical protein HMPREF9057_01831 [Actinomyces sp. oral taxon 171 str. F0337]
MDSLEYPGFFAGLAGFSGGRSSPPHTQVPSRTGERWRQDLLSRSGGGDARVEGCGGSGVRWRSACADTA